MTNETHDVGELRDLVRKLQTRQLMVPELTNEEWQSWLESPEGLLACPVKDCGTVSAAYWNGVDEVLKWPRCKHRAFIPEYHCYGLPPDSHRRSD